MNQPPKITPLESLKSIKDCIGLGKAALAALLDRIDTKLADIVNTEEDES